MIYRVHLVCRFEIAQLHVDVLVLGSEVHEVSQQFQYIMIDVYRIACINHHFSITWEMCQGLFDGGLVEE
jgi:hypothetical protein